MRPKVLWLIKGLARGGAEQLVATMAPRMDRHDVSVAYLLPGLSDHASTLRERGIEVHCLDARHTAEPGWPWRLRSLIRDGRYDIVHTHSPSPAAVARVLARRSTRFVHTEHNLWSSYRRPTYLANLLTYARNDAVFAVSDAVRASIVTRWWAKASSQPAVVTLRHGIDPATVIPASEGRRIARGVLGLPDDVPVLGTIGSLTPQKDHVGLLRAFSRIRDGRPEAVLLIIGTGPLDSGLRALAAELGLGDHVRLLGARDDVPDVLPALDLFLLSSQYEGLPIGLIEAMAAGVACIATQVGGIPEVITDDVDGRLVPAQDPGAMASAAVDLLDDPDRRSRLAAAGAARAVSAFAIDHAVDRLQQCYDRLLGR